MASFPASLWTGNTRGTNLSDAQTHTTWHDDVMAEVKATQTELGTDPALDLATVKAALLAAGRTVFVSNFSPGTVSATTGATLVDWITVSSVTLPTWTTTVIVHLELSLLTAITASCKYALDIKLGTVAGGGDAVTIDFAAVGDLSPVSFTRQLTTSGSGAQNLVIQARRFSGTGQMQTTGSTTKITGTVLFKG